MKRVMINKLKKTREVTKIFEIDFFLEKILQIKMRFSLKDKENTFHMKWIFSKNINEFLLVKSLQPIG
jgi:DNA relaxase NicK